MYSKPVIIEEKIQNIGVMEDPDAKQKLSWHYHGYLLKESIMWHKILI